MPVHAYTIKAGASRRLFLLYAREDGRDDRAGGKAGLAHDTPGASAAYIREGESHPVEVPLRPGVIGEWSPGGFVEVDAGRLPGVYQFGAPDPLLAAGSTRAVLMVRFPGAALDPVEIDLVAFDPQDSDRLGMAALGPEGRVQALRGAFPRLAAKEIEEGVKGLEEGEG